MIYLQCVVKTEKREKKRERERGNNYNKLCFINL
jgi:hypothetical protein